MDIKIASANRALTVKAGSFAPAAVQRDIYRDRDIEGDFTILNTDLPAAEQTRFKVYANKQELLVAVIPACHVDHFDAGDSLEIFFDPYHDHVGYVQFYFTPGQPPSVFTHLPYDEAASSAFPQIRLIEHSWLQDTTVDVGGVTCKLQILLARFALDGIFRNGPCCGFNIARYSDAYHEPSSWNHCTGNLLQDASGFGHLYRGADPVYIRATRAELQERRLELAGTVSGDIGALTLELVDPQGTPHPLSVTMERNTWAAAVDLPELIAGRYRLYPKAGSSALLEPQFLFFDLNPPAGKRPFALCMTYDIPDDLRANAYSPERLQSQFRQLHACGIRRLYWVDYPPYKEFMSFWNWASDKRFASESYRRHGDLLPLAAKISKQEGLGFMGIFKPFDLAFTGPQPQPKTAREATRLGLVKDIDERYVCAWPEIANHQECTIQTNTAWRKSFRYPVQRLTIYSAEPLPTLRKADIRLWVSKNNARFSRYTGRFSVRQGTLQRPHYRWTTAGKVREPGVQRQWFLEISGLNLKTPFVGIEVAGKAIRAVNRTFLFMEAMDAENRETPLTLGTSGDTGNGFEFGNRWGWTNMNEDIIDTFTWQNRPLGIMFAERPNLPTILEPAYPEVRALWLKQVERILKSEADGVDIRTLCHHNVCPSWLLFAFAPAVRDEFRRRFGREVEAKPEDYERIRKIRGEFYTDFIRAASQMTRRYGKKFCVHLEPGVEVPAHNHVRMQMTLDWKTWLAEGLLDEITLKYWSSQSTWVHEQVLPLARKAGVSVYICDRNFALNTPRAMELGEWSVVNAANAGFAGFNFYENCSYFYLNAEGASWPIGLADHALKRAFAALRAENQQP